MPVVSIPEASEEMRAGRILIVARIAVVRRLLRLLYPQRLLDARRRGQLVDSRDVDFAVPQPLRKWTLCRK
jgi:hypothetical protein